jgi:hypothetical protein
MESIMHQCPECLKKGKNSELKTFINQAESWRLHLFPLQDIWIYADAFIFSSGKEFTDVLKCTSCDTYGYVCPYCKTFSAYGSDLKHGRKLSCIECRREFIMRNPSNFLSWR